MISALAVIGANYGDEGKGLLTDYYVRQHHNPVTVVRFNGGAQAGHTVQTPEGLRHVFSHFGSGTLAGASTVLSRDFIVNPLLFDREYAKLHPLGFTPQVTVDPRCIVTTPIDMWLNALAEDSRGAFRHGSVGVGIWETIVRNRLMPLTVSQLKELTVEQLRQFVQDLLWSDWVPVRAMQLDCFQLYQERAASFDVTGITTRWIADVQNFLARTRVEMDVVPLLGNTHAVFEGAQGLAIHRKTHPEHSTPSNTGLDNVVPLLTELNFDQLDVVYATRAYVTRHGAGPLPYETAKPYAGIEDRTNVRHAYQGDLRFAHLSIDALWERILDDTRPHARLIANCDLAVTCLDQVSDPMYWIAQERIQQGSPATFLQRVLKVADSLYVATGPTWKHVRKAHVTQHLDLAVSP